MAVRWAPDDAPDVRGWMVAVLLTIAVVCLFGMIAKTLGA